MRANTNYSSTPSTPSAAVVDGRWDVPGRYQGQIVERAFSATGRDESGPGAPWMRVSDRSPGGTVEYFRRAGPLWVKE